MVTYAFKIQRLLFLTVILTPILLVFLLINRQQFLKKSQKTEIPRSIAYYPGAFVRDEHPLSSNRSHCSFNYGLPKKLEFSDGNLENGPELDGNSPYRVLYNVVEGKIRMETPPVTYATHVTVDFVSYIPELARFWDGHISVAAFVPDTDLPSTLQQLTKLCFCLPEMSRVSVHLVFHYKQTVLNSKNPLLAFDNGGSKKDCRIVDSSKLSSYRSFDDNIMYPINVCRNVARTASVTEYVLVSDIQLMPSEGLASRFLEMVYNYQFNSAQYPSRVFVVPVFEVEKGEGIPRTKEELVQLIKNDRAVYFHRHVCTHCQKFPGLEGWMESSHGNYVVPFITVKREVPYNRWEPIYIGTKYEPFYNEVLSWEGLQDKMIQMLEMCLIGYKFVILDGAFLVHWPGMKKKKKQHNLEEWRLPFVKQNARQYNRILKSLSTNYTPNPNCKLYR